MCINNYNIKYLVNFIIKNKKKIEDIIGFIINFHQLKNNIMNIKLNYLLILIFL